MCSGGDGGLDVDGVFNIDQSSILLDIRGQVHFYKATTTDSSALQDTTSILAKEDLLAGTEKQSMSSRSVRGRY